VGGPLPLPIPLLVLPLLVAAFAFLARPDLRGDTLVAAFVTSFALTFFFLVFIAAGVRWDHVGWTRALGDTIWLPADAAIASGVLVLASPGTRGWRTLAGLGIVVAGMVGILGTFLGFWFSIDL
jgi:hypothetical protein